MNQKHITHHYPAEASTAVDFEADAFSGLSKIQDREKAAHAAGGMAKPDKFAEARKLTNGAL